MKNRTPLVFLALALISLLMGIFFGLFASLQYIIPDFLKEYIPFNKMRPFHTSTVISWIILAATGSIYFFIIKVEKLELFSLKLMKTHIVIFILTGIGIYTSFLLGKMEGREYLAFTPVLTIPILIGWFLFGVNYFKTLRNKVVNWPVYYWMWGTGIVFMIFHLCEAHLWLLPSFRRHAVMDMTIQWKSYGSFVGSWNMLIYGIAIYLMSKIKKDSNLARGKTVFFFYYLGLSNLMLAWAHHTYIIPTAPWIRYLAYAVSMSEWIVLAHIIYSWFKSLSAKEKEENNTVVRFLVAADFWVFLNIVLALLMSIPAINFFTHGTHITVAHSMGTTIGINTTILFASLFYVISHLKPDTVHFNNIKRTYLAYNTTLFLFFCALVYAGIKKSDWMYFSKDIPFSEMQDSLYTTYIAFFVFGVCLVLSIIFLAIKLLKPILQSLKIKTIHKP